MKSNLQLHYAYPPPPHTHTQLLSLSLCCLHYDHIPLLFLKNNDWPKWSFKFVYCALITSLLMTWLKIMLLCCLEAHIAMLYLFIFWAGLCLSPSIMSVTLPLSVLPALWPDTIIVLEEQWLTLMIILIWCIEYSVFIGASVICFDFTKPVKCQVNFKNISQYLSLSLSHTHDTWGESEKITAHTDDRVNGPLLKVFPPPELFFRIHGTGSDRFPFKSMCQLKSVQSRIRS